MDRRKLSILCEIKLCKFKFYYENMTWINICWLISFIWREILYLYDGVNRHFGLCIFHKIHIKETRPPFEKEPLYNKIVE